MVLSDRSTFKFLSWTSSRGNMTEDKSIDKVSWTVMTTQHTLREYDKTVGPDHYMGSMYVTKDSLFYHSKKTFMIRSRYQWHLNSTKFVSYLDIECTERSMRWPTSWVVLMPETTGQSTRRWSTFFWNRLSGVVPNLHHSNPKVLPPRECGDPLPMKATRPPSTTFSLTCKYLSTLFIDTKTHTTPGGCAYAVPDSDIVVLILFIKYVSIHFNVVCTCWPIKTHWDTLPMWFKY